MTRKEWYDRVFAQIRFKPDHSVIWEELKGHLDDKRDALMERGWSSQEANEKALEAMGDPEELGRQLNAIHKPWLGWLWRISRWMLAVVLILALWFLWRGNAFYNWDPDRLSYRAFLDPEADTAATAFYERTHRIYYWEGDGTEAKWDRYTFRIDKAAVWGDTYQTLYGYMTVSGFLPWEDFLYLNEAYAVDDLGNFYSNSQSICFDWDAYSESGMMLQLGWGAYKTPFTWWYAFEIRGLDPDAQWVELRYERDGRDIVLPIDLTGGESQ